MKYLSLDGLQYFWQKVKSTFYSATNQPPYPVTSVNGQTGDVTVAAGGAVTSVNNKTGAVTITKSDVGLGNVDNTADANKPISTATQTALNEKASSSDLTAHATDNVKHITSAERTNWNAKLSSYTETDPTVPSWAKAASKPSYTKSEVGLANVDNTADANKSVANADTVDNKHASDFLGATATAANSAKLGGSLPSAFAPAPTVLYNNTSGSNSTITLSQSAANFTHMRIYYNRDNSLYQSVDVYSPDGKTVALSTWQGDSSNIYFATALVSINTTSITWVAGKHILGYIPNGGTNNIATSATPLKIVRVEAWN